MSGKAFLFVMVLSLLIVTAAVSAEVTDQGQAIIINLDISGSMRDSQKWTKAIEGVIEFVQGVPPEVPIFLCTFGSTADKVRDQPFSSRNIDEIKAALARLACTHSYTRFDEMAKLNRLLVLENPSLSFIAYSITDGIFTASARERGDKKVNLAEIISPIRDLSTRLKLYAVKILPRPDKTIAVDLQELLKEAEKSGSGFVPTDTKLSVAASMSSVERQRPTFFPKVDPTVPQVGGDQDSNPVVGFTWHRNVVLPWWSWVLLGTSTVLLGYVLVYPKTQTSQTTGNAQAEDAEIGYVVVTSEAKDQVQPVPFACYPHDAVTIGPSSSSNVVIALPDLPDPFLTFNPTFGKGSLTNLSPVAVRVNDENLAPGAHWEGALPAQLVVPDEKHHSPELTIDYRSNIDQGDEGFARLWQHPVPSEGEN